MPESRGCGKERRTGQSHCEDEATKMGEGQNGVGKAKENANL